MLDSSSSDRVKSEVVKVLVEQHKELLQGECETYLRDDKRDDLSRMFRLLSRIDNGVRIMLEALQQHVIEIGFNAVKAIPPKEAKVLMSLLLLTPGSKKIRRDSSAGVGAIQ